MISVINLPTSLRTELRIRIFLEISRHSYFVVDTIEGFSPKTVRRLIKEFISDNLVERRVLMYHISKEGQEVIRKILAYPDLRKFLLRGEQYHSKEEYPRITIIE